MEPRRRRAILPRVSGLHRPVLAPGPPSTLHADGIRCVIALALCLATGLREHHQSTNFYWVPTRAWELLLGTLVAFGNVRTFLRERFGQSLKQVAAASGLILVLYSIVAYDSYTPVPGSIYALAPAGGTALILAFGGEATITGKILRIRVAPGRRWLDFVLRIWHQPLFTFARYLASDPHLALPRESYLLRPCCVHMRLGALSRHPAGIATECRARGCLARWVSQPVSCWCQE